MIKVSDEVKRLYHQENVPKQLFISISNNNVVNDINFYYGTITNYEPAISSITLQQNYYFPFVAEVETNNKDFTAFTNYDYLRYADYICFSTELQFLDGIVGDYFVLQAYVVRGDGRKEWILSTPLKVSDYTGDLKRIGFILPTNDIQAIERFGIGNPRFSTLSGTVAYRRHQIELGNSIKALPTKYKPSPIFNGEDITDYVTIDDVQFEPITNDDIVAESFTLNESLCSQENLKFGLCESSYITFSMVGRDDKIRGREISPKHIIRGVEVPLGTYTVESVRKNTKAKCVQKDVTAYDALYKLNQVVEDWYTQYMYGIDTIDAPRFGYEFARQIFSTYYNLARHLGIEKGDYAKTLLMTCTESDYRSNISEKKMIFDELNELYIVYSNFTIDNPDVAKAYIVESENPDGYTDEFLFTHQLDEYLDKVDSLGRGVLKKASVLVEENRANGFVNRFVCDCGDQFILSPDTTSINIYIPALTEWQGNIVNVVQGTASVYQIDRNVELANGSLRLMYYNYNTKEIFPCTSEVTARDIIRSLMEVCGCFYTLDRYGNPAFRYCTKAGLYPSETLYPKDELFPILNSEETLAPAFYYDFDCEDYEVQDFGRIQILKQTVTNEAKSIVQWQYTGDDSKGNTYIIDDNVFYCHENMEYDYDGMPEVSEMLENMYTRISNIGYTPHDTKAIGLPYMECGDRISLLTQDGGIETFIFSRNLSGIQSMVDNYESHGTEKNKAISDFGYTEWGMNNG